MKSLRNRKKERGVATILVVGVLLFFLLFFFVLAIDFAYVYTARGQLQNAADAAALAGAFLIKPNLPPGSQGLALTEAQKFAAENYVTREAVSLAATDVEFGHWDGTNFNLNETPVNAIKVTAKRVGDNAVRLYFGQLVGWPTMDIVRVAIAARPARANIPIAVCVNACEPPKGTGGIINASGTKFYWATPYEDIANPDVQQIGWTEFDPFSNVTPNGVAAFFCGSTFDSCDTNISTSNGVQAITERQLRCAFLNPLYDSEHKDCENNLGNPKACDQISDKVTAWRVLSPLTNTCPPSTQGSIEPYDIIGYAEIQVTDTFAPGTPSSANAANNCACSSLGPENYVEPSYTEKALVINGISCIFCEDPEFEDLVGTSAVLVR